MADALKACGHDHRQREFDDEHERVGHGPEYNRADTLRESRRASPGA